MSVFLTHIAAFNIKKTQQEHQNGDLPDSAEFRTVQ